MADEKFDGSLEDFDDSVFLNADHFRLHRFNDEGVHDKARVSDFPTVMREALIQRKLGYRVVVYAVAKSGRHQAMVPERWEHYAKLYNERQEKKQ
jgi:hypothetical protein